MPRKFLGERIDPNVDAIRPASLTLTSEDLMHIPIFKFEDDNVDVTNIDNNESGKRLSRKFGGTIKLKKRLKSVPEIFIHDYKKRVQFDNDKRVQCKNNSNNSGIIDSKMSYSQYDNINKSNNELRPKNLQERRVLQRRSSSRKLFYLPELPEAKENSDKNVLPSILDEKFDCKKEEVSEQQLKDPDFTKSNNSKIFQDIIACYGIEDNTATKPHSTVFNQELERVLDHVVKIDNMNKMQREIGSKDINHLCLPTKMNITPLTPTLNSFNSQLSKSNNCEIIESTPSSSMTERSHSLNSPNLSTTTDSSSTYNTALEDFDSLADLSITKIPSTLSEENMKSYLSQGMFTITSHVHNTTKKANQIKTMHLRTIDIKPVIATIDYSSDGDMELEEDDYIISPQYSTKPLLKVHPRVNTIRHLQEKIDHINLSKHNTILSSSSSVYS